MRQGKWSPFSTVLLSTALAWGGAGAADDEPGLSPGLAHEAIVRRLETGRLTLRQLRRRGLEVFTTPFNQADGHGDGPFDPDEFPPFAPGHRPTLQGNGRFLRVNGLDSQSCNECHSIVRASTVPPRLGIGGVGGAVQNALILPTLMDVADSFDERVAFLPGHDPDLPLVPDGIADYNGRVANPPFLFGGGGVELVAKEMTADLQELLRTARNSPPGTITPLLTHGVSFGSITSLPAGEVELDVQGIGFVDNSSREPEEILVVRPFGRKGENFSMRDFDRGAMQFHFGMQPVEVVGRNFDEDGDGVKNEVEVGDMTALHVFDVSNPKPFMQELDSRAEQGLRIFRDIGCASCHVPVIETRSRSLPLAFPEVAEDPFANVYLEIDLVELGFEPAPGGGVLVPLFADLKRHDMGSELAESLERPLIPNRDFTTARLWGIADTAPYLHDGRSTSISEAIGLHGGEAESARDAFLFLPRTTRSDLIHFLKQLRTPEDPNQDLVQEKE